MVTTQTALNMTTDCRRIELWETVLCDVINKRWRPTISSKKQNHLLQSKENKPTTCLSWVTWFGHMVWHVKNKVTVWSQQWGQDSDCL